MKSDGHMVQRFDAKALEKKAEDVRLKMKRTRTASAIEACNQPDGGCWTWSDCIENI